MPRILSGAVKLIKFLYEFLRKERSIKTDFYLHYFFIPLPEAIDLPDGYTFKLAELPDPLNKNPLLSEDIDGVTKYFSMSLVVHQMESTLDTTRMEASIEAIIKSSPKIHKSKKPKNESGLKGGVSVVEAACIAGSDDDISISNAFDVAIETIRHLQKSVYSVNQRPKRLVHMKNLPFFIPYMTRNVDLDDPNVGWPDNFKLFMVNPRDAAVQGIVNVLDEGGIKSLDTAWNFVSSGLFTAFGEMRREAMYAYETGNNITAMLLIGAACETFLREISLILWWEEGLSPQEVSAVIRRDSINPTINTVLPPRLGGNWNQNSAGILNDWRVKVANIRNQVIHAGYSPSDLEIESAFETHHKLENFVGDLLADNLRKYPVSTSVFLGNKGLVRRGKLRAWKQVTANLDVPVDVAQHFGRWKKELQRIESNGPFITAPESCSLYAVMYPNKEYTWWLVDIEAKLGCRSNPPGQKFEKRLSDLINDKEIIAPISIRFDDVTSTPLDTDPNWLELYKFLPLFEIHRWPFSYYDR